MSRILNGNFIFIFLIMLNTTFIIINGSVNGSALEIVGTELEIEIVISSHISMVLNGNFLSNRR